MNKEKHLGFELIAENNSGQQTVLNVHDFIMQFLRNNRAIKIARTDKGIEFFVYDDYGQCWEFWSRLTPCYWTEEKVAKLHKMFTQKE